MVFSPKHCRLTEHCTPRTFKQLLMCATQHHPTLSAEEIADRAGIPLKWLYDYANEGQPNRNIPAVKLVRVIEVTGRLDLIRFLLAPLGHTVVAIQEAPSADRLRDEVMDVQYAVGKLAKFTRDALKGDEYIDEQERETGLRVFQEVETETAEAKQAFLSHTPQRATVRMVNGGQR